MPIKLYMDENVPRAITNGLRAREVDVLRVQEDGRLGDDDRDLLLRAAELGRVLFTRDDDFFAHAGEFLARGESMPGLVYAHQLRATIGQCVRDLEVLAKAADPDDLRGEIVVLPL